MTTTAERAAIMAEVDKALTPLKAMGGYYDTLAATMKRAFHAVIHFGAADDEPATSSDAAGLSTGASISLAGEAPSVEPSPGPDPSTGGAHPVLERL